MNFLMVDGVGAPNTPEHTAAIEALYSVSYTLKFLVKKSEAGVDYGVLPLEGLWWAKKDCNFINGNKSNWIWRMMIMQPEYVTDELVTEAIAKDKLEKDLSAINKVQFRPFKEGKCAQTLYVGPFSEVGPTVEKIHAFIKTSGYETSGKQHEIYLTDMRRSARENWKTIIRQPMS